MNKENTNLNEQNPNGDQKNDFNADHKPIVTMPAPKINKRDILFDGTKSETENMLSGKKRLADDISDLGSIKTTNPQKRRCKKIIVFLIF